VTSIGDAESVELRDMMTWEQAPTNPRRLDAAGIDVSLTTSKLRDRSAFRDNLLKAIKHGLTPEKAFAMVTTHPAALLKVDSRLGTVEAGKVASLVIADGNLFDPKAGKEDAGKGDAAKGEEGKEDAKGDEAKADQPGGGAAGGPAGRGGRRGGGGAKVRDVWVDGVRHEINPAPVKDAIGAWVVVDTDGTVRDPAAADSVKFYVSESAVVYQRNGKETRASNVRIQGVRVDYTIDAKSLFEIDSTLIDHAVVEGDMMYGVTPMPSGKAHKWTAKRTSTDSTPPRIATPGQGLPGRWIVTKVGDQPREKADAPVINFRSDAVSVRVNGQDVQGEHVAIAGDRADFTIDGAALGFDGMIAVKATLSGTKLSGIATTPDKQEHTFSADRQEGRRSGPGQGGGAVAEGGAGRGGDARKDPEQEEKDAIAAIPEKYGYPFGPYMMMEIPEQKDVLINHATIWTSGPDGIIQDGFIFIHEGKIAGIGTFGKLELPKGDFITIDAKGKFISPGIIDCHSHTGISKGVNEGGQAVTAEVRIQDVTDPDSISWYRQLGGGVTTVNNLHGSANAIGGQNCVNKNRWGAIRPDDLHFEGAIPGIKFALGENPKWSNNGDRGTNRYPQTRMGVETLIRDRFTAAKQYLETAKAAKYSRATRIELELGDLTRERSALVVLGRQLSDTEVLRASEIEQKSKELSSELVQENQIGQRGAPPRRDLELEALGEIIEGKRLVHCHSYRQDEILMLCRIADEFKFKIGTFQHVLEGYKVADEIAKHAIGGSCFSDWWAYKVEVQDAIPQDGPIMSEQGVVVSFNSDSDELARRLNWEAAKAVKYGKNMKPEDALKFVTLNPAKQLMIDKQVGSLEVGKDADFVIWSGPPMSAFSRCEATYVDGRKYFSLEDDAKMRVAIAKERGRLIQKLLAEPARGGDSGGGGPSMGGGGGRRRPVEGGMLSSYYLDLMNRGYDPSMARPGDCGCGEMHE